MTVLTKQYFRSRYLHRTAIAFSATLVWLSGKVPSGTVVINGAALFHDATVRLADMYLFIKH